MTPACVRAPDHVRSIVVETVVGEIDADVDELGRAMGRICVRAACAIVRAMNCSGTLLRTAAGRVAAAAASGETVAELDDAAARMQYAFYTGDTQGIERS